MAYKKEMKVVRWSLSGYQSHRGCPFRYAIERILRTGVQGYPLERGDYIHNQIERFLKSESGFTYKMFETSILNKPPLRNGKPTIARDTLAKRLAYFKPTFTEARKAYKKKIGGALIEEPFAFDSSWNEQPITDDYRTTNWGPIWLSGKLDYGIFLQPDYLRIDDWKTGQIWKDEIPKYEEQLDLYALVGFLKYPFVNVIQPRLAWLDVGEFYVVRKYEREELPKLKKRWSKAVKPMLADRTFAPLPNRWCGYCPYGQERGDKRCKH